jgi:hypothetical protein
MNKRIISAFVTIITFFTMLLIAIATEEFNNKVSTPISHLGGTTTSSLTMTLTTTTESALIYYTLDGSTPSSLSTPSSMLYTEPFPVISSSDTIVKAIAVKEGMIDSDVMIRHVLVGGVSPPSKEGGGGGGSATTPPTPTVTTTPIITAGTTTWAVTNIPRTALTALGLSSAIPVNQIRIPTGATGAVFVNVGAAYAGQNAVLVRYNTTSGKFEFVSAATVGANGNANINISQAGDFLVLTFKTGDVTGTGEIQTADALAILRHVAGISELNSVQQFVANGKEGDIGTIDALNILRYVAGIIENI